MMTAENNVSNHSESEARKPWVVVLAGGQGSRLLKLTAAIHGRPTPKQFAVLNGDHSMLQMTVRRALWLTTPERVLVVVNAKDADVTRDQLRSHPEVRVILQPFSGGTALGILQPVLLVAREHPQDDVVVLPSDHHFARPICFVEAIESVLSNRQRHDDLIVMGAKAQSPSSDFGWVLPVGPARGEQTLRGVGEFIEKPAASVAERLLRAGAVVSTMITIGTARGFEAAFMARMPKPSRALKGVVGSHGHNAIRAAFLTFGGKGFSRTVLEHLPNLKVVVLPDCGWVDLGTAERVRSVFSLDAWSRLSQRQ